MSDNNDDKRRLGVLHKFFADKGFGFLRSASFNDDGSVAVNNNRNNPDTFLHISRVQRDGISDLQEGDLYEFDIGTDRRGKPCAVNLVRKTHEQAEQAG
jgi:CspA family cold shock protein